MQIDILKIRIGIIEPFLRRAAPPMRKVLARRHTDVGAISTIDAVYFLLNPTSVR
jgi:hypothetical protein